MRTMQLGALVLALVLSSIAAPVAVDAQRPEKLYRIGMLERTPTAINAANLDGFRQGLRELGYVEGKNFVIEYRSADGRDERFPGLATELVRLKVDLILTRGTPAALAAKNATGTIPVVMTGIGDPVGQGVVASLARPGGNVTGLSAVTTEIYAKRVELLRELVPGAARLAALFNMSNPSIPPAWKEVETAARSLAVQPQLLDVRKPEDLGPAFDRAIRQRADALVVGLDTLTQANQRLIVDLAAKHRLPAIYASMEFAGGLVVYGVNYPDLYRRAASFADKIFKGATPADLPVEQPTKFELVINTRAAKALGLTIPSSLLLRADHVIQFNDTTPASSPRSQSRGSGLAITHHPSDLAGGRDHRTRRDVGLPDLTPARCLVIGLGILFAVVPTTSGNSLVASSEQQIEILSDPQLSSLPRIDLGRRFGEIPCPSSESGKTI